MSRRDAWIVMGLLAVAVGLPAVVGIATGAISVPHNDDFAYRRAALSLYETGRLQLTGWAVMTLVGQLVVTMPLLWLAHGASWAFAATTAAFAIVGIVAGYALARRLLTPGRAGLAVLLAVLVPGFLLYTTSYMTEVPAFAMEMSCLALGAAALHRTPETHRWRWLAASLVVGCYAFSIREYAFAAPVAVLAAATLSDRHGRWLPYALAAVGLAGACAAIYAWTGDMPGQGSVGLMLPTPETTRRVLDATAGICLALAPALLLAAATWIPRWRRSGRGRSALLGGLAGIAVATVIHLDRLLFLVGRGSGDLPEVFIGNVFASHGSLDIGLLAGNRPLLYRPPTWDLLGLLALVATFVAFALLGAGLAAERDRLWRLLDVRSRPSPLGSVAGTLLVFAVAFAVGTIVVGLTVIIFDRYTWPLVLPLAILLLTRREPAPPPTDRREAPLLTAAAIALTGVLAATSLALVLDTAAFEGARWRMGEEAVRLGFAPETVDAGFEWVGMHATGLADLTASAEPAMTGYAVKFPSFHQCAVVSSSPLGFDGFTLVMVREDAYRTLLVAGPPEPLYLYRVAGPDCPRGP